VKTIQAVLLAHTAGIASIVLDAGYGCLLCGLCFGHTREPYKNG